MRLALVSVALAVVGACTPSVRALDVQNPAHPDAPVGRLAGPPAALRVHSTSSPQTPAPEPTTPPPAHDHGSMQ